MLFFLSSLVQSSTTGLGSQSSADHGGVGLAGLRLTQSLADLQVELHEAGASLRQVPAGAHHRQAARLAQRLVTEVDVQKGLDCVVCLVAEDVVGPQRPADKRKFVQSLRIVLIVRVKQVLCFISVQFLLSMPL